MATNLNGPGDIAGEAVGGTGENLNERPDNSTPGGGAHGSGGGNSGGSSTENTATQRQIDAVVNDPVVKKKLAEIIKGAKALNPAVRLSVIELTASGTLKIQLNGLSMGQATGLGLKDIITLHGNNGAMYTAGSIETGHVLGKTPPGSGGTGGSTNNGTIVAENKVSPDVYLSTLQGEIPAGFWLDHDKVMTRVSLPYVINGGGKGDDRTVYKDTDVEVPSLTEAYRKSKEIQADVAEAARQAEAARKAEEARKALFDKAGIQDTPVYTPEMVKAANVALTAGGSMALSRAPGMIQLSAAGMGTLPFNSSLAGWEAGALWRGVDVLARIAPVASAVVTVATVLTLVRAALDIPTAGEGSDRVPGRNIDMLAAQASLFTAMKTEIQPGMKTVDLPVRGYISNDGNGRQSVNLVRTGTGGISATVPVLNAVRDKTTGLDKITVPAVAGAPSRTILVNPVPVGPAAPSHTGNNTPAPVTPVHTGTEVKQADSIVTTTFPAADMPSLQDFIYWQLDATGTGVEPIYVMLASPRDLPGKVSGKGESVSDGWLNKAGQELGSPIPSQIADKLRGREFANFDAFRRAVWDEVGKDTALSGQFNGSNRKALSKGYSPFPPEAEQVGGRTRYELHHKTPIKDGGAVYDIDNIGILTPKRHIELHRNGE
ncbi:S-type pyocin domain-containing protein [Raoultella ornithinolytica]|uniref:S-type pyocin domain-containing protein n=1 Tax=Raoultella ornithinolytica TaxID=54291 RepID=UPI002DBB9654|nr:S-type pyocin domain-containing protein [Raoultella ornithinolytica]MEB6435641.1 S-type pyocin domain-containing protein [Raoultella ornithinolytica]